MKMVTSEWGRKTGSDNGINAAFGVQFNFDYWEWVDLGINHSILTNKYIVLNI